MTASLIRNLKCYSRDKRLWQALLLSAAYFALIYFYYRLFYDYTNFLTHSRNILFGSDTDERILTINTHGRHLLHHIISSFLDRFFYLFLDPFYSAKLISAVMGASASLVIFFISRKLSQNFFVSALLFLSYALSAVILIFSSIPESFMTTAFMTNILILCYLYFDITKIKYCVILGVVVAASCLASGHHLLTIGLTFFYILFKNLRKNKSYIKYPIAFLITCFLSIVLPIVLCGILIPKSYEWFLWHFRHQSRYFWLPALAHYDTWKSTLTNFFLFSISPPDYPLRDGTIPLEGLTAYFTKFPGMGFVATYWALLAVSVKKIYDYRYICHDVLAVCVLAVSYLVFFVGFDSHEAFTFSSFFLFFQFCVIAKGASFIKSRLIYLVLSLFIVFILINNATFLKNARDHIILEKDKVVKRISMQRRMLPERSMLDSCKNIIAKN